jgi:hypothetical protein
MLMPLEQHQNNNAWLGARMACHIYNWRNSNVPMFISLLDEVAEPVKPSLSYIRPKNDSRATGCIFS